MFCVLGNSNHLMIVFVCLRWAHEPHTHRFVNTHVTTSQTDLYHSAQRAEQKAEKTHKAELLPAGSQDPFLASLVTGPLSNKDDIIHRQQRLAVGNLDFAAYSAGPHLSCAKFKACLKRAGLGLQ